jgi:excisionase family DNA binding protein
MEGRTAQETTKEELMCNRHDPLWTVKEVAEYLSVPVQTLYDWRCKHEGPPALKIGRHLRFRESDVFAWLDAKTVA